MQFLFPSFLWALLALAIPIIIHLFHFRRFKKVYFTNVKFLKELKEETSNRNRIKNLLVLLSRLLALGFLVFAFAQPILFEGEEVKAGRKAVSVFVDNSFSMNATQNNAALLTIAKERARQIIQAYGESDEYQILTNELNGRQLNFFDKSTIASLSLKSAIICSAPTNDAEQFWFGSKTITLDMCSGIFLAASVSIIPSCPPPIIPRIFDIR